MYEINELLDCCDRIPKHIRRLRQAIMSAHNDSSPLYNGTIDLIGEFEHIKHHIRRTARMLHRVADKARDMPPLSKLSDNDLHNLTMKEAYDALPSVPQPNIAKQDVRKKGVRTQAGTRKKRVKERKGKGKSPITRRG